jgi:hypothetical protein
MKKSNKKIAVCALAVALALGVIGTAISSTKVYAAQPTVNLGTSAPFAILAYTEVSDAGAASVINGNVGLSPSAGSFIGLLSTQVTGTIYDVDGSGPANSVNNPGLLTTAKNDLSTAYTNANGRTPVTTLTGSDNQLGGKTLTAGTYTFSHATSANLSATPLVLDGQNDPSAIFIFQAQSDLITASNSTVQLINGAQACNVFWTVPSSATLGSYSTFVGTIMAYSSIGLDTGATLNGRALASNGAVTLDHNTITAPTTCLTTTTTTTTPGLPNTGYNDNSNSVWQIAAAAVLTIGSGLALLFVAQKKRAL